MPTSQEILVSRPSEYSPQENPTGIGSELQTVRVMNVEPDPLLVRRFRQASQIIGVVSTLIGCSVLLGWMIHSEALKAWLPGQVSMKPNTALAVILAGIALGVGSSSVSRRIVVRVLALAVSAFGALALLEYVSGMSFAGVDNFLFTEPAGAPHTLFPGRMAPNSSVTVLLIGLAILLCSFPRARFKYAAQAVSGVTATLALVTLLGYTFRIEALYGLGHYMYTALPAAVCFLLLCIGIGCATAEHGFVGLIASDAAGSLMLRRILLLAVVVPWCVTWLATIGERHNLYRGDVDHLIIAVALMVVLSVVLYRNALELNNADAEREATKEVLRRSSEQWKLTFDCMSEGLSYHDVDYNLVGTNAAFRKLVGKNAVEGNKCFDAVHGCSAPHEDCPMSRTLETGKTEESEIFEPRLGKHLLIRTDPVRDSSGNIFRIVHVVEDITARKKAEENTRRLAAIVEQAEDAIFSTDLEGKILSCNRSAERIYGYAREELVGQNIAILNPPEAPVDSTALLNRIASGERLESVETVRMRKDGSRFTASLAVSPMRDEKGNIVGSSGIVRDISEAKRVQQEAQRTRAQLDAVVNSMDEGLYQLDTEGRLVFMNSACERLLGYTSQELIGRKTHDIIHSRFPDGRPHPAEQCPVLTVIQHATTYHTDEDWFIRKDASFLPVEYTSSPLIVNGDVAGAVLSFRDITERKRSEQERNRLHELEVRARRELETKNTEIAKLNADLETRVRQRTAELENANRELEAFSYSVSHDLRAPLRSLDGFSHILIDEYRDKLDDEGRDFLQRLRGASQTMGQLIDALLQLSRVSRSDMSRQPVNLSSVALQISEELRNSAPERDVTFEIEPGLAVTGDPRLMYAVLQNLLGNAWKFTSKRDKARIVFGATEQNGERVFYVRDNGAGFDMTYGKKLFGAFQRLHTANEFEGSGIGLATVQRIIRRHGGTVWAEGIPGEGATFFFTLA